jgi:hypothetical protein
MNSAWILSLFLLGAPSGVASGAPDFSVLSSGSAARPDGRTGKYAYFTCLPGEYRPGLPVLLLPKAGSEPCRVTTGEEGIPDAGTEEVCTALVGAERCAAPLLALVGASRASYSHRPLVPVAADRLPGLGKVVRASGVLEALVKATLKLGGPPTIDGIEALPESAHVISGMEEGPVFVRFRLKGGALGPIVVVSDGKASGPFESLCDAQVTAFQLDGLTYVSAGWGCCECGAHTDSVFAVERGGLRQVYRTIANSN